MKSNTIRVRREARVVEVRGKLSPHFDTEAGDVRCNRLDGVLEGLGAALSKRIARVAQQLVQNRWQAFGVFADPRQR
ncbi:MULTISPECIES: hypothetical protein [unclassified Caballeronia]|uniref:hypothetical protein n=1 Tax=unclassified Caballeronia TaxID=2646786 RepID=UPI002027D3D3|nr:MULTISPECIES: hypothetical protein [unclassified Caballeronia]MDR5765887.1 hypothetical protein [Caballeronia sp. LZ028]